MTATKTKKIRVYKLASEFNLSSDSLLEFLRKRGYEVKSHMSIVTEDMMDEIYGHFKKDIERAEKHYKKIAEFQKKMKESTDKDEQSASLKKSEEEELEEQPEEAVEEERAEEQEIAAEESETVETEEIVEEKTGEEPETVEAAAGEDESEEEQVEESAEEKVVDEKPAEEKPKAKDEKSEDSPLQKERTRKTGLKVVGKIDLDEKKPTPKKKTDEDADKEKSQDADKKKRKKKKSKKKKETTTDEIPVKKRKKGKRFEIDEKEVDASIRRTLHSLDETGTKSSSARAQVRKKKKKERLEKEEREQEIKQQEQTKIEVNEFISVSELANLMSVPVQDVITKCIELGLMVSINQRLDIDTINIVADEFGFDVEEKEEYTSEALEDFDDPDDTLLHRSPVVTIMGHVDHGKTSLLDYIRRTNVVAGESGGITQHIGAYRVEVAEGKNITFLDTPGHEAFTAMRARGAQITDIVVLIVAADDAVMPQTIEAINHAQAAGVPIIVAINKIDKPAANIDRIKQQLAEKNVLIEEWGGKYQAVQISAKQGTNVDQLLEKILLEAEMLELKANPDRRARGVVIESELDKGRGITATVLVQKGTLKIGDPFVAGIFHGRVRAMFDERDKKMDEAGPSSPALVLGLDGAPQAGDLFVVVESERAAREVALKRQQLKREQDNQQVRHLTLDEISRQISLGGVKELPIIVKGDVDGSVEALSDSLMKLSTEEVVISVIHRGVGAISESDVLLAAASQAIIVGFHVRPHLNARKLAESQNVDIRIYSVIYDAINEVRGALEGMLSPIISEEITGTLEVRETFKVPKAGTVAGCYVQEGRITRNNKVRLIRDGVVIYSGEIDSLKRFKDDVREVDAGYECGIGIANFNDIKIGDIIESYKLVETKKTL